MRQGLHATCHWLQNNQAIPGELSWKRERLSFRPSGKARDIKKYHFQIDAQAIDYLFFAEESAHFVSGSDTYVFFGPQTKPILTAIHERQKTSLSLIPSDPVRILLQDAAECMANALMSVKGELTLTNVSLAFEPSGVTSKFGPSKEPWKVNLKDITAINFSLGAMRLSVQTSQEKHDLSGGITPRLYNVLRAFCPQILKQQKKELVTGRFEEWEASLFNGPLSYKGYILMQRNRFFFTPASRFDAVAGAKPVSVDFSDLVALRRGGWPERRIELCGLDNDLVFTTDKGDARFAQILYDFTRDKSCYDYHVGPNGVVEPEVATKALRKAEKITDEESVIFSGIGLYEVDDSTYIRGLMALTDKFFFFWPTPRTRKKYRHLKLNLKHLKATPKQQSGQVWNMGLSYKKRPINFIPLGGGRFADLFWAQIEFVQDIDKAEEEKKELLNRKYTQPVVVFVNPESENEIKISESVLEQTDNNQMILMCSEDLKATFNNEPIKLQVKAEDGIFDFSTRVISQKNNRGLNPRMPKFAINLAAPQNLAHKNRRKQIRASRLNMSLQIYEILESEEEFLGDEEIKETYKQDEEAGLLCRLHDISVHGFMLRTGPIFELGLKVRTILPIAGNPLPIIAECIRYNEPEEKKGLWQYGFKFKYVSPKERSMIFQFITQQHVIAKRRLERDLWDWGLI